MLVTGATDGIGLETSAQLARRGAHVLVHGRNPQRATRAIQDIGARMTGARLTPVWADLASLRQVQGLVQQVRSVTGRLDVLVNNAGVFQHEYRRSEDGHELTFAVNHLAHFALTLGLVDWLRQRAPARVVTVSSAAHASGRPDFDPPPPPRAYEGYEAYARSKLANLCFTRALARRLTGTGVTANALHPGVIATKMLAAAFGGMSGRSVAEGALTSVYLATSPDVADVSGRYFVDRRTARPSRWAEDDGVAERLWELSERLSGVTWPG